MEVAITPQGTFELLMDKGDIFLHLVAMGFTIAVVVAIIVAAVRLGWKMWPALLIIGLVGFLLV